MKKVLIISHNVISLQANNGKTLASIFGAWPTNDIAQLYFNFEVPEVDGFCTYYRLSEIDVLRNLVSVGCNSYKSTRAAEDLVGFKRNILFSLSSFVKKRKNLKLVLRDVFYGIGLWKSRRLNKWISDFSPDFIFFLGGDSLFSFWITSYISRYYNLTVYVYLTDDYVLNSRARGVALILKKLRIFVYRDFLKASKKVFVIGSEMAVAYKDFFGVDCYPIMNCVDNVPIFSTLDDSRYSSNCVDVVYIGGLHLGRSDSLIKFNSILSAAFSKAGLSCVLSVYSVLEPDSSVLEKFDASGIKYCGALSASQVASRLKNAHYVLHVESFDADFVEATKYSVSTKISEYLSSGAIVIGFGPSTVASIKLLAENLLGIVVSEDSLPEEVIDTLVETYRCADRRSLYINRALDFARENFLSDNVRKGFRSLICA